MAQQIGSIPEFTEDTAVPPEEVKEAPESVETETPDLPADKPGTESAEVPSQTDEQARAIEALQKQRTELLKEIQELRGTRREIKQEQLKSVETQIDELKDVHPDDLNLIEKVLRSKGYLTKEEQGKMLYESVKTEELAKFLDKYPEYKPENDPNDVNWQTLQREFGLYKMPENPRQIGELLERAHRSVPKVGTRTLPEQKRRVEIASVGGGGVQQTSSQKSFSPEKIAMFKAGGFSDEDIKQMEARL